MRALCNKIHFRWHKYQESDKPVATTASLVHKRKCTIHMSLFSESAQKRNHMSLYENECVFKLMIFSASVPLDTMLTLVGLYVFTKNGSFIWKRRKKKLFALIKQSKWSILFEFVLLSMTVHGCILWLICTQSDMCVWYSISEQMWKAFKKKMSSMLSISCWQPIVR